VVPEAGKKWPGCLLSFRWVLGFSRGRVEKEEASAPTFGRTPHRRRMAPFLAHAKRLVGYSAPFSRIQNPPNVLIGLGVRPVGGRATLPSGLARQRLSR